MIRTCGCRKASECKTARQGGDWRALDTRDMRARRSPDRVHLREVYIENIDVFGVMSVPALADANKAVSGWQVYIMPVLSLNGYISTIRFPVIRSSRAPRCACRMPLQLFGQHTVPSLLHSITVGINGDLGWRPEIKRRPVRHIAQERYSCLSVGDPFLGMRPTRYGFRS
jgi:hypothetical protein